MNGESIVTIGTQPCESGKINENFYIKAWFELSDWTTATDDERERYDDQSYIYRFQCKLVRDYSPSNPFVLFVELSDPKQSVVVRLGTAESDRKSYDMFCLFKRTKEWLLEDDPVHLLYKKSLFGDEFEKFTGFHPFGFTLVHPSYDQRRCFYRVFRSKDQQLLEFCVKEMRFERVRIFTDITKQNVLGEKQYRTGHTNDV